MVVQEMMQIQETLHTVLAAAAAAEALFQEMAAGLVVVAVVVDLQPQ
jgi:hypothetical protein